MIFFKSQRAILLKKNYFIKEVYYKLYKMFVIFFRKNVITNSFFPNKKTKIFHHNLCAFSFKTKSLSRKLKLSRILIRELSNKGFYFGLHKISW